MERVFSQESVELLPISYMTLGKFTNFLHLGFIRNGEGYVSPAQPQQGQLGEHPAPPHPTAMFPTQLSGSENTPTRCMHPTQGFPLKHLALAATELVLLGLMCLKQLKIST